MTINWFSWVTGEKQCNRNTLDESHLDEEQDTAVERENMVSKER